MHILSHLPQDAFRIQVHLFQLHDVHVLIDELIAVAPHCIKGNTAQERLLVYEICKDLAKIFTYSWVLDSPDPTMGCLQDYVAKLCSRGFLTNKMRL